MRQPSRERLRGGRLTRPFTAGVLLLALTTLALASSASAATEPQPSAGAWVLIDPFDGKVLSAGHAERSLPIASTTKLMTAYVARRELDIDELVTAPGYSPISSAESLLGLIEGERIAVRDLLSGLILASGNDAAAALAESASGSVERFVVQMNREARRLGLDDTSYANPIGLDDPANFSSAVDLAELAAVLRRDRVFRKIFDSPDDVLETGAETREIVNRNNLVRTVPFVDGVKTGYTLGAGYVLVASGSRDGVTLISAVLGEPSEAARDADSLALLEYGFSLYRRERVVDRGEELTEASVADQDLTLPILAEESIELTARRGQEIATRLDAPGEVEGPIERGEKLGNVVVTVAGDPRARTALVAGAAIPAATIGDRIDSAVPGPSLVAWAAITAALALVALGALRLWGRRGAGS